MLNPKNPYVSFGNRDFLSVFGWTCVLLSVLYVAVYVAYLIVAVMKTDFLFGYFRPELLPGPLIDDRYSVFWWFLMLNNLRILAVPSLLWIFQSPGGRFKMFLARYAFMFVTLIDVVLIVTWFVFGGFFCNDGRFRNGMCDAPRDRYCASWWTLQPDLCPPSLVPPTLDSTIPKNPAYWQIIYFTAGFLLLDVFLSVYLVLVGTMIASARAAAREAQVAEMMKMNRATEMNPNAYYYSSATDRRPGDYGTIRNE
jgi:hypothetical protein